MNPPESKPSPNVDSAQAFSRRAFIVERASDIQRNTTPEACESLRSGFCEGQPSTEISDEKLEALLRKIGCEVVAQQMEKVTEFAVRRASATPAEHPRAAHDLTPVADLPLPARVAHALARMRIKTVAQLTAMREEEILLSPNLGERSLDQLKQVLGMFGRSLSGPQCLTRRLKDSTIDPS